jgi:phosphatidate cytidylyltransferase
MINILRRTMLFFIGIPALIAAILLFPEYNSPIWIACILLLSAIGTVESAKLFIPPGKVKRQWLFFLAGLILPGAEAAHLFQITGDILLPLFLSLISLSLLPAAFNTRKDGVLAQTKRQLSVLHLIIYPGLFMAFMLRIMSLEMAQLKMLLFLTIIFSNDTFAYIFGSLLGKHFHHPFSASPNKSTIGFLGGFLGALFAGIIFTLALPKVLPGVDLLPKIVLILLIALFANIGDLVESALKRSAGVKDSGTIMPGRGGVLDSTDSVFFSAPLYYYLLLLFF